MARFDAQSIHFFANKQKIAALLVLVSLFFITDINAHEVESMATSYLVGSDDSETGGTEIIRTETLDWFADNVDFVIPNNAIFTIKDVQTGTAFTAIRCSGKSHLDAEPASAEDTAVFKKILGGKWRWRGRPALIMYSGRVFAVSMCGMPHGTKTIKGNHFDGHFCIYFKSSRTHATDKMIRAYQNAVKIAGESSWDDVP